MNGGAAERAVFDRFADLFAEEKPRTRASLLDSVGDILRESPLPAEGNSLLEIAKKIRLISNRLAEDWERRRERDERDPWRKKIASALSLGSEELVTNRLALEEALDLLEAEDPRHFQVVILRLFAGASQPEIAATLGISGGAVRHRLERGLEYLRGVLGA